MDQINPASVISADAPAMTPEAHVSSQLANATELRRAGELSSATGELETALSEVRVAPYEIEFQTRIRLATSLADLYLEADAIQKARDLLADESAFAEKVFQIMQVTGTKEQKRDAAGGRVLLRDRAQQVMLIGAEAPEIDVNEWVNGEATTLASLLGRVVLLEFWATWCKPCREMFTKLKNLDETYRARGLEVIALTRHYFASRDTAESQAEELNLIRGVVTEQNLRFRVGVAKDERTQDLYGATGLPTVALIGRTGIVRYIYFGNAQDARFDEILDKCLAEEV